MEIYETKEQAIAAMNGRIIRLVKIEGGWALMSYKEYAKILMKEGYR